MSSVLIKIGGSTVNSSGLLSELGQSIAELIAGNDLVTVVHGGGKDIAADLEKLNKEFTFVEGQRVTDSETMTTVQKVLTGAVNKRIVANFLKENVQAFGLSGVDGQLLTAEKLTVNGADIGFVGKIKAVKNKILTGLHSAGLTPIISPVSLSDSQEFYNINADLAASETAIALSVDDLVFISDVPGVLINGAVQSVITLDEIEKLIDEGHITGGMIPKMRSAADAINRGVGRVHICGWRDTHTLKEELHSEKSQGTTICK